MASSPSATAASSSSSAPPAEGGGGGGGGGGGDDPRDPSGYLTSSPHHPSTVVRVVGTARDDINGLLGTALSYNVERERYLVRMSQAQATTMALKKENLVRAGMVDRYRSQWQQLRNDPRVREKVGQYVEYCTRQVRPFRLSHVAGGVAATWAGLCLTVGFTKTIMVSSLLLLLGAIAGPDLLGQQRQPPLVVLQRLPSRARETLEQQMPLLRGRLTDRMAAGVVLLLVALCGRSLFSTTAPTNAAAVVPGGAMQQRPPPPSPHVGTLTAAAVDRGGMEAMYDLGFQDATAGRERGHSFQAGLDGVMKKALQQKPSRGGNGGDGGHPLDNSDDDDNDPLLFATQPMPPPQKTSVLSKLFRVSTVGSVVYVYRLLKDKGTDTATGLFSLGQLVANLQHRTEVWQQGMLLFSVYNILRALLS